MATRLRFFVFLTEVILLLIFCLLSSGVNGVSHKKIIAFFQETCNSVVPNPCKQVCHDIPGGGFICDCQDGWKLDKNGRDCVVDPSFQNPQLYDEPQSPQELDPKDIAIKNSSTGKGGKSENLSIQQQESISQDGQGRGQNLRPKDGADNSSITLHSIDMKGGLEPPQALYQIQEGGAPSQKNGELSGNIITEDGPDEFREEEDFAPGLHHPIPECLGISCQNNGTCVSVDGYDRCNCPLGTIGSYCEKRMNVRFPKFRGTGYLGLPVLRDAYKEFAVAMEFKPEAKNGLLMFSAEHEDARKDFFSIVLINGIIEFRFDCGTGSAVLRSPVEVMMGQWNTLIVARNDNQGSLQLNGADVVEGSAPGPFTRITLRQNLYLGGFPYMDVIASRINTSKTFVGCIQELIVNGYSYDFRLGGLVGDAEFGINVGDCSEGLCDSVTCQNSGTCHVKTADSYICLCPIGFHGDFCEKETPVQIPRFSGHSHLEFEGLGRSVLAYTEIEAVVKPESPEGMILYNGYKLDRKGDFISLVLRNGYVEFSFDLGTGPARIRSKHPISQNQWHVIRASRTGLEGVLKIDDQPEVVGQAQGAYTQLTLLENLFVGGHHNYDHTSKHANLTSSFTGCIQKIVINKRPLVMLEDKLDGRNIEPCEHPCAGEPCMNGGECLADGEVYHCNCLLGFSNTNCEDKMEKLPTKPMFSGDSFLFYTDKNIVKRVSGNKMDLQIHIKPKGRNGLLFWSGQDIMTVNSDYIALGFLDGSLQLRYNLGSGEALIGFNDSRLFDGDWHFVRVQRDNRDAYMEVDSQEIVEGSAPGSYTMLNTNRVVYLGGMPNVAEGTGDIFTSNYVGCVKDVMLATDLQIKLLDHAQGGRNVQQCRKHL